MTATNTAATAFSAITGSTNTGQALLIGTGSSLGVTGLGTIQATNLNFSGTGISLGVAPTSGQVLEYNGSTIVGMTLSGSSGITYNAGAFTIGNNAITNAMLANSSLTVGATAGGGLTGGGSVALGGSTTLGLLTSCGVNQTLQWNGAAWACATPTGTGTVTATGTPGNFDWPYWTSATNLTKSTVGLGYTWVGNNSTAAPTISKNPISACGYTTGADVGANINLAIQANTNGVSGDAVDASCELSSSNTTAHSMFPQNSLGVAGYDVALPAGLVTTSVPQKIESSSSIVRGKGRGGTNGKGGTEIMAGAMGNGIGSGGAVTCTGLNSINALTREGYIPQQVQYDLYRSSNFRHRRLAEYPVLSRG